MAVRETGAMSLLEHVEDVAGAAALAAEAAEALHDEMAELKRRALCLTTSGAAKIADAMRPGLMARLEETEQAVEQAATAAVCAWGMLEAQVERLAALEARAQGAGDV